MSEPDGRDLMAALRASLEAARDRRLARDAGPAAEPEVDIEAETAGEVADA